MPANIAWTTANSAATSSYYKGMRLVFGYNYIILFNTGSPGYLATITSPEEHNFLVNAFGPFSSLAYLGASDAAQEGKNNICN